MTGFLTDLDWHQFAWNAFYLVIAFLLALPVGLDRERARRLGLRTIPLVSVAACGFVLVGRMEFIHDSSAVARIIEGVVAGIGFLGGGAIVKSGMEVHGTATAATIWCTAAIGVATGIGRVEIAVVLALFNFGILVFLRPLHDQVHGESKADEMPDERKTLRDQAITQQDSQQPESV